MSQVHYASIGLQFAWANRNNHPFIHYPNCFSCQGSQSQQGALGMSQGKSWTLWADYQSITGLTDTVHLHAFKSQCLLFFFFSWLVDSIPGPSSYGATVLNHYTAVPPQTITYRGQKAHKCLMVISKPMWQIKHISIVYLAFLFQSSNKHVIYIRVYLKIWLIVSPGSSRWLNTFFVWTNTLQAFRMTWLIQIYHFHHLLDKLKCLCSNQNIRYSFLSKGGRG